MLVIAHRGANREDCENSWGAFEKAIDGGAERIELDVQMARDGSLVINHDDSLAHTVGVDQLISDLDRGAIEKLKLTNGEGLPFLEEVVDRLLPRVELNLEIKSGDPHVAERTMRLLYDRVKAKDAWERIIISSFRPTCLMYLADHYPEVKLACLWSVDEIEWPLISYFAPPVFMSRCRAKIFHPYAGLVTAELMDQARARGWQVYPWVSMKGEEEDRDGLWAFLKTVGVDGLCTNYPRQLASWLKEARRDEERFTQA